MSFLYYKSWLKFIRSSSKSFIVALLISVLMILFYTSNSSINNTNNFLTNRLISIIAAPINYISRHYNNLNIFLTDIISTKQHNILLKQQIASLKHFREQYDIIAVENSRLKSLLHFIKDKNYSFVSARMIATTPGPFIKSAIISAGYNQNIQKDQVVLNDRGVIGRVIDVGADYSRILFVNDFNSKIPAITAISREHCIVAGNNTTRLELLHLAENSQIKHNELILTSGDGKYYPPGLPVARIIRPTQNNITATSFLDIKTLEFVMIVQYQKQSNTN